MIERQVIERIEELLGKKVRKITHDEYRARYKAETVDGKIYMVSDYMMEKFG